ncbi:MAG TPA: hypothetical protein PK380_07750 [Deltaproteobacteria bacterium]|nr:hypothetical protein [Deltaproteobacteria bacterium]
MDVSQAQKILEAEISGIDPDMARQRAIEKLMGTPESAAMCRLTDDMMYYESLVLATEALGTASGEVDPSGMYPIRMPATKAFMQSMREMSPGIDGLGIASVVRVLEAGARPQPLVLPGAPTDEPKGPGLFDRITSFFLGPPKKSGGEA